MMYTPFPNNTFLQVRCHQLEPPEQINPTGHGAVVFVGWNYIAPRTFTKVLELLFKSWIPCDFIVTSLNNI